ncbi:MAG: molybdopterin-dependent oxidoreductase [Firmicutes bacterium]|nr:molybdopterin-dependent oxidoreductase [Bacillota bacterium]
MVELSRRSFLKLGAAGAALLTLQGSFSSLTAAKELTAGGKSVSPRTKKERQGIPSVCLQCVSGCGIIGYVEDGRIVKIEGNPEHPNNRGRLCAKGQAGINNEYDPERILYPMKRVGARGEGKWKRISREEAYSEVAARLREVRDLGRPEEFAFHYGRNRLQDYEKRFMYAFGSPTILDHTAICEASKKVGQELTWGTDVDINDAPNSRYLLNFGCSIFEAHVIHNSFAQRVVEGQMNGARLVTFDVRLSNTAARSNEWFPIKPGTDGLVALAMANVIMREGLYDKEFLDTWTNYPSDKLAQHLKQFTPEMAEKESGVPAADIRRIAIEFATARPATTVSYRGACSHENGAMNERCIILLNAITGNVDVKGGFCLPRSGKTKGAPDPKPEKPSVKSVLASPPDYPLASHAANQLVLPMIKAGKQKIKVYMTYWYNPAYSLPDTDLAMEVLKDERLIPYFVAIDAYMSEATALADIILPDSTYLERWDPETAGAYSLVPYVALRQPVVPPLGEAVPVRDMFGELARRIGGGMEKYFDFGATEDYIRVAVLENKGLAEAGGLEYLKKHGAWYDKSKKPDYKSYAKPLKPEELAGATVDANGYSIVKTDKKGKKQVVGVMVDGKPCKGFPTGKHGISGKFEIYSKKMEEKGFPALPTYVPVAAHRKMKDDELILTTFKVSTQTQSRTANCKWLTEISHDNPLWIHPRTAAARGIKDGDTVKVVSRLKSAVTRARVTEGIHPGVVAFAMGSGHWEYGRVAGAKNFKSADRDTELIWWEKHGNGVHLNSLIPVAADPVGGGQPYMDTVVTVTRA